ncbi:MAG: tail fiber domain-containing protein [Oscillospiraceae bacterium]
MSEKFFVGLDITGFENTGKYKPISRVTLMVDDENVLTAGDDTGLEITASCPHATQTMVNAILSQLQGYEYQSFTADAANLDPSAELGDGVTVSGLYSFISRLEDDGEGFPSISAPGEVELEDEYPSAGPMTQEFNRKIAETRSTITKTAEEIRLEVENEIEGLSSSISVQLDSITSTVQGLNGQVSTISQKVNNITLTVQNGTDRSYIDLSVGGVTVASQVIRFTGDVVFESSLTDGSTMISGDNILTGEVSAEYIRLGGEMRVYEDLSDRADLGGYIGYVTSYDYNGSRTYGMGMIEAVSENQVVATSGGVRMTTDNGEVVVATNITLDTRNAVNVYANRFTSDVELNVTSDRNAKDDIRYDVAEKYISLFDRLNPVSFLYKGKEAKRHLGFIAQDVEDILNEIGMPLDDFAALSVDEEGRYGLSYGEFVAVLTAKIQQLERKIEELTV